MSCAAAAVLILKADVARGAMHGSAPEPSQAAGTSHLFARKQSVLWAGETFVCFSLFYLLMTRWLDQSSEAALHHAAVYAATFGVTASVAGIYRAQPRRPWLPIGRAVLAALLSLPAAAAMAYLAPIHRPALLGGWPQRPVALLVAWVLLIFLTRLLFGLLLQSAWFARRVVVLGTSTATAWIRSDDGSFYDVLPCPITPNACDPEVLARNRIWAVVLDPNAAVSMGAAGLERLRRRGIRAIRDTTFLEACLNRIDPAAMPDCGPLWAARPAVDAVSRTLDAAIALMLLIATLPVLLLVTVAMKLEDPGPVLFRQRRVGLHGREFTLLKFRSMRLDAEAAGPVWAQQRDPRVTRIGGWLRRTHLDELPQLFNILRGEMSMVGPRPERLHFVQRICQDVPRFTRRNLVKPGLTGWAQVNYPYGASIEDAAAKLSYDLYYVRHRGVLLYVVTLLATVRVVLFQEGSR